MDDPASPRVVGPIGITAGAPCATSACCRRARACPTLTSQIDEVDALIQELRDRLNDGGRRHRAAAL